MNIKRTSAFVFTTLLISTLSACGPRTETGYTVSFQTHGGTPVETLHNVTLIEEEPVSERNDYVLEGWYTSLDSEDKLSFPLTVSEDMTLHAKWLNQLDPSDYYGNLTWTNSEDLINKLHAIIHPDDFEQVKYEGNWDTNRKADEVLTDHELVDIIYENEHISKTLTYQNGNGGWQREHAFPASLMTGLNSSDAASKKSRATDFHNLFAASYNGNTSRGNKNFGDADPNAVGYAQTASYSYDPQNFEPSDNDKGDVARAIFYMAVMYNTEEAVEVSHTLNYNAADQQTYGKKSQVVKVTTVYKPLTIQEEYVNFSAASYTQWYYKETASVVYPNITELVNQYGEGPEGYGLYLADNCQYAIGNLSHLLRWNSNPVDLQEYQHNIEVFAEQLNRNPFVDYPGLVDYCFGDKMNQAGSLADLNSTYNELDMARDEIHHYAIETAKREYNVGDTFTRDDYTLVAIKNNLDKSQATFADTTPEYTFTEADGTAKKKVLTIETPYNDISYTVAVKNEGPLERCSYKYTLSNTPEEKALFPKDGSTPSITSNLGGKNWNISVTNPSFTRSNYSNVYGLQLGVASGSKGVGVLTLETVDSVNVDAIFFRGSTAASATLSVKFYVNNDIIMSKTLTRTTNEKTLVGGTFTTKTGKVKIVITSSTPNTAVVYFDTLAFNEVN